MAIYTKTGDRGKTSTFSGKRISKSSKLIRVIGTIDELNSYLGVVGGLTEVQRNLFTINAILTGAKIKFPADATKRLERKIDDIEDKLPVQKNFLIYGGTKKSTQLYFARAICRRAEREMPELRMNNLPRGKNAELEIRKYINRLSDYLFIIARWENYTKKIKEEIWKSNERNSNGK